jgi:hypothetical protein
MQARKRHKPEPKPIDPQAYYWLKVELLEEAAAREAQQQQPAPANHQADSDV